MSAIINTYMQVCTHTYMHVYMHINMMYPCEHTYTHTDTLNVILTVCLSNNECINDHRFERTNVAARCKIFMNCSKTS